MLNCVIFMLQAELKTYNRRTNGCVNSSWGRNNPRFTLKTKTHRSEVDSLQKELRNTFEHTWKVDITQRM